jgi:hypothetical protein
MSPATLHPLSAPQLRALCGLSAPALERLLEAAVPVLLTRRQERQAGRAQRQRAVGGVRKRRLRPEQEILLTLIYLRHNVAHAVVGALFGVSADTSENTFYEVIAVLQEVCPAERWDAEKRWKRGEPAWTPTPADQVLIDSFETPVSRPSQDEAQRRCYSGKKKRHTLKSQVVTNGDGEVLEIDPGHRGPRSAKKRYEASGVAERYPEAEKRADLGYQGLVDVKVPHKKPKGGTLSPEQLEANRQHASLRVRVEHGIRRLKAFRILRDQYRLARGLFPRMAFVVVGLVHLQRLVGAASS